MPRADYCCPECGYCWLDVYFRSSWGAAASAPVCPQHEERAPVMDWIPAARFDLRTDGEGTGDFHKFTVHRQVPTRDGLRQVEETVDSLHALRRVEQDSEQRFRDGEGEPLRFRLWNQTASNKDVNSFGTAGTIGSQSYDSGQPLQKSGKVQVTRHGQAKPQISLGPGMRRAATALKG